MSAAIIRFPARTTPRAANSLPDFASKEDVVLAKRGRDLLRAVVRGKTLRERQRALDEWFKDEDAITEASRRVIVTLAHIEGKGR